ncbi:MAG: laccase domain-containing protein [bacterium]|nr:laccase domain-containing protein [bacterium]
MIEKDQPTNLDKYKLTIAVSSLEDGTMTKRSLPEDIDQVIENRQNFIAKAQGDLARTALVYVTFDQDDYCRYHEIKSSDMNLETLHPADALVTKNKEIGIFLPLADCCGVVLYDSAQEILMVSHIGRQSVEQYGSVGSVQHLVNEYGTKPQDIYAWLSPTAGEGNYPIHKRGGRGLRDLISNDLLYAGVQYSNIEMSEVDTTVGPNYYSHSEYLKGNQPGIDGRFAIYASMKKY